jgi:hypothetical protein
MPSDIRDVIEDFEGGFTLFVRNNVTSIILAIGSMIVASLKRV